jgi:hypothetical protein
MKFIYSIFFSLILFASCQEAIKKKPVQKEEPAVVNNSYLNSMEPRNVSNNLIAKDISDLIGYWVGDFDPDENNNLIKDFMDTDKSAWKFYKKLNLSLDSISGDSVFGHSVVSGTRRPLNGNYKKEGNSYLFSLMEPGDDKFDGKFEFKINENDSEIVGTWQAFGKIKVFSRKYTLRKTLFQYNANTELESRYIDGNKMKENKLMYEDEEYIEESYFSTSATVFDFNSSLKELNSKDVENLSKADIYILRNSIYARHGYSFKSTQLSSYFQEQSWYYPVKTDIKKELSALEKKNIGLLMRYEKNAEEYYDVFGR